MDVENALVSVRLLGGFGVSCRGRSLDSLPPRAVSLLSHLVLNRDRPQTRDLLAGRFWGDLPDDRSRKRLSNCLWQIRAAVKEAGLPDLLRATSAVVQCDPDLTFDVDVESFEERLDEVERELHAVSSGRMVLERLATVVGDYTGDLLPGYYQDWLTPERDRLRGRYHLALSRLVALYKAQSDYEQALRHTRELAASDPLTEEHHQEAMRLYALLGQFSAAERQFEQCRNLLEQELGVEPSPGTVELREHILTEAPNTAAAITESIPNSIPMVGRSRELATLVRRAEDLLAGSGGVVLVEGEPGIGKTRLIEEFASAAAWRNLRVLKAGHNEFSRMQPYASLGDLLATAGTGLRGEHLAEVLEPVWLRQAAQVLPDLKALSGDDGGRQRLKPDEEPSRMREALARVVMAQGDLGPAVLVLEDVHWCDDDSMQVLKHVAKAVASRQVLLCMTFRRFEAEQEEALWSGISEIESLTHTSRIALGSLNTNEVRELIFNHMGPGGLATPTISRVAEVTGGNPLFVIETARHPAGVMAVDDQAGGSIGSLDLPEVVAGSLRARILALAPGARRSLEALAVLGEPGDAATVAAIAGLERIEVVENLARMVDEGLLTESDRVCRFGHEQTRTVVYQLIDQDERVGLHSQVYITMSELDDPDPAQMAHHARMAKRMDSARCWFLEAADRAVAVNAYQTAAEHYGQADEAAEEYSLGLEHRAGALLALEAVLDVLGRRDEQTMLLKRLDAVPLPAEVKSELAERKLWLLLNTDEPDEGIRLGEQALRTATEQGLPVHGLLTALAVAHRRTGDLYEVPAIAERAYNEATTDAARVAARTVWGKAIVDVANYDEGLAHLRAAIEVAEEIDDRRGKVEALGYLAVGQFHTGEMDSAEQNLNEALRVSREIGYRWGEGVNLLNLASVYSNRGSGGLAWRLFDEARDALGSVGDTRGEAFVKLNQASMGLRLFGNTELAAEQASSAAVFFRSVGDEDSECWANCVLARVDIQLGRRRMANRRLADLLAKAEQSKLPVVEAQVRRIWAKLLAFDSDYEGALAHLGYVIELCDERSLEGQLPYVAAMAASLSLGINDRRQAESLLGRALAGNTAGAEMAHVTAHTCGRVAQDLGREDEAREQYRLAYNLLTTSLVGLSPELVDSSWTRVPEHAAILESYERRFEIVVEREVPIVTAPTGRPLTNEELITVRWTVSEPSDRLAGGGPSDRRKRRIVRLCEQATAQGGSARVADLALVLGVSERTIKRDLAGLRAAGQTVLTRKIG